MDHNLVEQVSTGWKKKKTPIIIVGGVVIGLTILITSGIFAYGKAYEDRIYPNIWIDSIDVGGRTQEEAYQLVDDRLQEMLDNGLLVEVEGQTLTIDLRTAGSSDQDLITDYLYIEVDSIVEEAFSLGRGGSPSSWPSLRSIGYLLGDRLTIYPDVTVLDDELEETIRALLVERALDTLEEPGEPTRYNAYPEGSTIAVDTIEGTAGSIFDFDTFFEALETNATTLSLPAIELVLIEQTVDVTQEDGKEIAYQMHDIFQYAPYALTYTSQNYREYSWEINEDDINAWVIPVWEDNELVLTLSGEGLEDFIEEIHETIDVKPKDARFTIEGDRVTEFSGSQSGVMFDEELTIDALTDVWGQQIDEYHGNPDEREPFAGPENNPVQITIITTDTEADITTGTVNNLGINEVLGVGVSDISGSPSNRISNILHGSSKLNGLLIAPGDTLSLLEALRPFTVEDGYLPELVIKGDEIIPEVGGGLCQLGTTAFRAAMNSGLEIAERRNHSLVVSYYNDMTNGNPGTDATIYDPAPDFKVRNDTENYVLLTTEVDLEAYEVIYTFWGTSDGREGYYSLPEVLSWSGASETQYIETLDLAPGALKCQSAHPGATASFTYYVDYEDGEQFANTYTSTYRSLPQICLIGVEELSCNPEEEECPEETEEETSEDIDSESGSSEETVDPAKEDPENDIVVEETEEVL